VWGEFSLVSDVRICEACRRPLLRTDTTLEPLTDRELDVVRLLTAGMSIREIAARMKLSEKTVNGATYRAASCPIATSAASVRLVNAQLAEDADQVLLMATAFAFGPPAVRLAHRSARFGRYITCALLLPGVRSARCRQ
jgi:hypothetical protein